MRGGAAPNRLSNFEPLTEQPMMNCMEMGMGMMLAMGAFWILVIAVLVLAVAALVKYLRSGR